MSAYKKLIRAFLRSFTSCSVVRDSLRPLAQSGLLPEAIWKRLPVGVVFRASFSEECSFLYSSTVDHAIGRSLFWRGLKSFQPETSQVFARLAKTSDVILIVGANTGLYALLACAVNPNCKVVCFEPVPGTYEKLVENVVMNGWQERCDLHREAVSNETGLAMFHVPFYTYPAAASLNPGGFRGYKGSLIEVPVTTADAICSRLSRVDLVLVDVEGFEDKVLEGMRETIDRFKPAIILECLPDGPFRAVDSMLRSLEYQFLHLREEGPVLVSGIVPDSSERYLNYLCTPKRNRVSAE